MAITYGMSTKEFWEQDPDLFWAYRYSYIERINLEQDLQNQYSWLQGAYFYEAVSVALNNGFNKQKLSYSKKPYGTEQKTKEDQQKELEMQVTEIKARIKQINKMKGDEKG